MSTIVVTTFELADGVEADAFVEADSRYQQDVAYQQPGLGRRTTSVGQGTPASWCIIEQPRVDRTVCRDCGARRRAGGRPWLRPRLRHEVFDRARA